ncbi:hypothetical protein GP486_006381 [Trichoglossum hirsutum]|uniref:VWFA domain-containing protein n=1 Tax=Trichoglossum hirsutum TaxID=265104 RepID=A0A9P8IDS8_9PEZI|nr:hypothetical protein GP486_006381 [Trichoglossum hirsutum]
MTRDVVNHILLDADGYFPGEIKTLTTFMIKARNAIADADSDVDSDEDHDSAAHFDAENFKGGQDRLVAQVKAVVSALADSDGTEARKQLGKALHTVQDFYAHTNWVEMGQADPHPSLGKEGVDIVFAGIDDPTCVDCKGNFDTGCANVCLGAGLDLAGLLTNIITGVGLLVGEGVCLAACTCPDCSNNLIHAAGGNALGGDLTSGYYHGEGPEHDAPASGIKCHHGGIADTSTLSFGSPVQYRAGINKDSLACNWSPHFNYHTQAVTLAKRASRQFIDLIRDKIPEADRQKQMRILFGVGPPLAFAIDTTGSMGGYISAVRAQTIQIVDSRLGTPNQPSVFILEPFNDPAIGPIVATSDGDAFKAALSGLSATGGGDCPELSMEGMLAALAQLPTGGSLIVITDAAAKNPDLADQVIDQAVAKKVKIFFFIFDSLCSEEPAYGDIAEATGGQAHTGLDLADASLITSLIDVAVTADIVNIAQYAPSHDGPPLDLDDFNAFGTTPRRVRRFSRRAISTPFNTSASIPLDPAMSRATFSVSGASGLALTRPDGSLVMPTDTGVSTVTLSSGIFTTVLTPPAGKWGVKITDCSNCTLAVFGDSSLKLSSFDFVKDGGGHPGFFPITDPLTAGADYPVIATLDGNFSTVKFQFRSLDGGVIRDINMESGTGEEGMPPKNSFFGAVQVPRESFLIYVSGNDTAGHSFVRVLPALVGPTPSNGTFNGTNPTNTTSSTLPTSSSGPYANSTSMTTSGSSDFEDTTTVIVYTTVSTCPITSIITTGSSASTSISSALSTVTVTSTSVIPCMKCTGPNYPQNNPTPGIGSIAGPGKTGHGPGPASPESKTTVTVLTSTTTCPVTQTLTSGGSTYLQTTYTVSTVLVTKSTVIPYSEVSPAHSSVIQTPHPPSSAAGLPAAPTTPPYGTIATSPRNISASAYAGPIATGGAGRAVFINEYGTLAVMKLGALGLAVLAGALLLWDN